MSPGSTSSTGTCSMPPSRRRWAKAGARAISAESSRCARRAAACSSAAPPDIIRATIAAARYSPSSSAAVIATSAMTSTPSRRRASARATAQTRGTSTIAAESAQTARPAGACPARWSTAPARIASSWPVARRRGLTRVPGTRRPPAIAPSAGRRRTSRRRRSACRS